MNLGGHSSAHDRCPVTYPLLSGSPDPSSHARQHHTFLKSLYSDLQRGIQYTQICTYLMSLFWGVWPCALPCHTVHTLKVTAHPPPAEDVLGLQRMSWVCLSYFILL